MVLNGIYVLLRLSSQEADVGWEESCDVQTLESLFVGPEEAQFGNLPHGLIYS
jgi:hypothetical protein